MGSSPIRGISTAFAIFTADSILTKWLLVGMLDDNLIIVGSNLDSNIFFYCIFWANKPICILKLGINLYKNGQIKQDKSSRFKCDLFYSKFSDENMSLSFFPTLSPHQYSFQNQPLSVIGPGFGGQQNAEGIYSKVTFSPFVFFGIHILKLERYRED